MTDLQNAGRPQTILVIEDEDVMRLVLSEKLSKVGYRVIEAADGAEGMRLALAQQPDLILLDNRMPKMGGFEMLKRLRENGGWGEQVPVIFFSNIEPSTKEEHEDIDAVGATYLVKSETSLDDIAGKIAEVLRSK